MDVQFINDEEGNPQYVVIGYEDYTRMISCDSEDIDENEQNEESEEEITNYYFDDYDYR